MPGKTTLLTILALAFSFLANAQKKDTLVRYFDSQLEPVNKRNAVYVGVVVKDAFGWNALIYNDSMKVIMRGKYEKEDCAVKNGWFIYYNNKGERYLAGKYDRNLRADLWQTWYPSGRQKDSIYFWNDRAEGPARRYFETGILESEGYYKAGLPDSNWVWHHENGQIATKEKYVQGKVASFECFDSTGVSVGMNCAINRPPAIKGKYGGIEKYLSDSIRYPANIPLDDSRYVEVMFTIYKSGSISEPQILKSGDQSLADEVVKAIKSVSTWYPAVSHNRNIDHTYNLSIRFLPDDQGILVLDLQDPVIRLRQ